jgi:hypothetical protein
MPDSFEQALALEGLSESVHRFVVPDGWLQGKGAFGGLVLAAMVEAMTAREEDRARTPRAVTGDFCGPAIPGEARILSQVLRRGRSQTHVAATLEQNGQLVAHATCVLSGSRKVGAMPSLDARPPEHPQYQEAHELPVGPPLGPVFAGHYEYRPTGPLPFQRGSEPLVLGWIKEREPLSRMTAAAMLGRVDAYWPAFFVLGAAPRPLVTVSFLASFLCDPHVLDPRTPAFFRSRSIAEADGYFVELRELWYEDRLVLINQQSFALLT